VPWTCPDCSRSFGRKNQAHGCAPSGTVDDYFADRPAVQRKIYDAIEKHVKKLGAAIDPVTVTVMFKRSRTFAEVRGMRDRLRLFFILSRELKDPRISRTMKFSAHRCAYCVDIKKPAEVDRQVREWLSEAYACSPL
jgi:hypothetical protein